MRRTAIVTLLISAATGRAPSGSPPAAARQRTARAPARRRRSTRTSSDDSRSGAASPAASSTSSTASSTDFEKENPNVHVDSVGERQRRQDRRRAPRRQRPRRDALVQLRQHRGLLLVGRLDRPSAVHRARPRRRSTTSRQAVQDYTEYQGDRCAMPLLADDYGLYYNKDMFDAAGHQVAAEDDLGARRGREEAHAALVGRHDRRCRLRPHDRRSTRASRALRADRGTRSGQNADGKSSLSTDAGLDRPSRAGTRT